MKLYQIIYTVLCFSFFVAGLTTKAPFSFLLAIVFGVMARTGNRRGWAALKAMAPEEQK